jgi:hypothetical protein
MYLHRKRAFCGKLNTGYATYLKNAAIFPIP